MPIRKRKPTSAGRRFQTRLGLRRDHQGPPERSLVKPKPRTGGRNAYGRMTARHRGGGHKQQYRVVDFRRNKDGVAGQGRGDRVRPEPQRAHRAAALRRRREALHHRPGRRAGRRHRCRAARARRSGPATRCRCATSRSVPSCTTSSSSRAPARKIGRGAGAAIQLVAKEGLFATLRLPSTEMRRVPIDCRATVGSVGNAEVGADLDRQGRPQPLEGQAPARPWCRHEPGRPPARRWRGQELRWSPPGVAVGQARGSHPQEGQGLRPAHRSSSPRPRQPEVARTCRAA